MVNRVCRYSFDYGMKYSRVSRNIKLRRDDAIRKGFHYNLAASETGDIRMRRLV